MAHQDGRRLLDRSSPVRRRLVDEVVAVARVHGHEAVVVCRRIEWVGRHPSRVSGEQREGKEREEQVGTG